MIKLLLGVSLVLGFGCGKKGLDAKLDELSGIKDKMCACTDKACADKVHEDYIGWKKGNSKEDKPNKDQQEKFEQIRTAMNECRHKLDGGGATEGAPPAPAAGSDTAKPAPTTP